MNLPKVAAQSLKVRGHWKTIPPQMHICKLEGRRINNDEAEITFSIYETDKKGNKKLYQHGVEVTMRDGTKVQRDTSAEISILKSFRMYLFASSHKFFRSSVVQGTNVPQ